MPLDPNTEDRYIYDVLLRGAISVANGANSTQLSIDRFLSNSSLDIEDIKQLIIQQQTSGVSGAVNGYAGRIRAIINEEIENAFADGAMQYTQDTVKPDEKLRWVNFPEIASGGKSCPDCDNIAGTVRTLDEWNRSGQLPGSGWSVCGGYCNCVLDPE